MIINETMMWLNKFTKENIEDDNKKKEHAHRQTESCSNSNAYGSPLGLEFEHKVYYIFVNGYLGLVVSR